MSDTKVLQFQSSNQQEEHNNAILETKNLSISYRKQLALSEIDLQFQTGTVTSIIGPSGSGKTSLLRSFNRILELSPGASIEGTVLFNGVDIYAPDIDPVVVRRRIGMVFQQPNPYPTSIWDNIAWGLQINGVRDRLSEIVEQSLRRAALWHEVSGNLKKNAFELSGGQQQRLCIARAIALNPDVLLFDEPTSNLDPVTASEIESLIADLSSEHTIIIVTHDLNMAARVSDYVAFLVYDENKVGRLELVDTNVNFFVRSESRLVNEYITRNHWMWNVKDQ